MEKLFFKRGLTLSHKNRSFQRSFPFSASDTDLDRDACPLELIVEALGRCIIRTIAAVADAKQIQVGSSMVHVRMELEEDNPWQVAFSLSFDMDKDLSRRECTILVNSAKSCEVSKILAGNTSFEFHQNHQD